MSCPDFVYSPRGRRGVGVVQPQSGLDYPFVAPSPDIRYLVADFHLTFDDAGEYSSNVPKVAPPLKIKYLYNVGCADNEPSQNFPTPRAGAAADIQIVDANGLVVFDTFSGVDVENEPQAWGTDYRIYSWKKGRAICNLLAYVTWSTDDRDDAESGSDDIGDQNRKHYDKYLTPVNATFDARAVYKLPKRLLSLSVKSGPNCTTVCGPFTGSVKFKNGRNTTITPAAPVISNFRTNTRIVFAAAAGSGLGRYSSCPDSTVEAVQPIKKINGIAPVGGDFLISATDCLYARRPTVSPDRTLDPPPVDVDPVVHQQIGADCPPCCKCSDYAAAGLYMNQVQSQYVLIGSRANDVKLYHEQNVAKWIDQQQCSINPLRLLLVPQRCPYMDVVLMLCNPCQDCMPASTLSVELVPSEGYDSYGEVICGYTAMYATGINGRPVPITVTYPGRATKLSTQFPIVRGGSSAYVQFRVKFSLKGQYAITGTLTGTTLIGDSILTGCSTQAPEDRAIALAEKTEALFCTPDGQTEFPC